MKHRDDQSSGQKDIEIANQLKKPLHDLVGHRNHTIRNRGKLESNPWLEPPVSHQNEVKAGKPHAGRQRHRQCKKWRSSKTTPRRTKIIANLDYQNHQEEQARNRHEDEREQGGEQHEHSYHHTG